MSVAQKLKAKRKEKRLTQIQLAEISGVSQQAISFIESSRNTPTEGTLRLLAKALNCPVSELLDDETQIKKDQPLTHDELRLLNLYGLLNESGKHFLMQTALNLVQTPELRQDGSIASMA